MTHTNANNERKRTSGLTIIAGAEDGSRQDNIQKNVSQFSRGN